MQVYSYVVRDFAGERKEGVKHAASSYEVLSWLREQELVPISVEEVPVNVKKRQPFLSKRVKSSELSAFYWQLTTMLESGVPVATALGTIAEDIENARLQQIIKEILEKVNKGEPFSSGVSEYPKVFNKLTNAMIMAGETSGNLPNSLKRLAEYFDGKDKFSKKVKVALAYPIFAMVFIILMVVFIMTFIIPRFKLIFSQLGGKLPAITQAFISVYDNISHYIVYIIAVTVSVIVSLVLIYTKSKKGHYCYSKFFLGIPLIGKILKYAFVAIFCKTMSALIDAGVSVLEVFNILSAMTNNDISKTAVLSSKERIMEGTTISVSMAATGFFPNMVVKMIQIGEESGSLPIMLNRTADFYERKVDAMLTTMLSLLEPIMIVLVGAIVLVVVLALYMPIFTMGK
jgi:type IV pilus assembly protein PilC